jgi:hypothetical protein
MEKEKIAVPIAGTAGSATEKRYQLSLEIDHFGL